MSRELSERLKNVARVLLGRVLGSFDLRRVQPRVVCVENNDLDRTIWRFMRRAGYRAYTRIRQDEIYVHA
jgi:hypothetical protein